MSLMVSKQDMFQLKLEPFKMTTFLLSLMAQMSAAEHPFKYLLTLHNKRNRTQYCAGAYNIHAS